MKKILLLLLLISLIVILIGCEQIDISKLSDKDLERIAEKAIVCNKPYVRYEMGCCLDQNNNNICDKDEGLIEEEKTTPSGITPIEESTTPNIPITTTIEKQKPTKFISDLKCVNSNIMMTFTNILKEQKRISDFTFLVAGKLSRNLSCDKIFLEPRESTLCQNLNEGTKFTKKVEVAVTYPGHNEKAVADCSVEPTQPEEKEILKEKISPEVCKIEGFECLEAVVKSDGSAKIIVEDKEFIGRYLSKMKINDIEADGCEFGEFILTCTWNYGSLATGNIGEIFKDTISIHILDDSTVATGELTIRITEGFKPEEEEKKEFFIICNIKGVALDCKSVGYFSSLDNTISLSLRDNIGKNVEIYSLSININNKICSTSEIKRIINGLSETFNLKNCGLGKSIGKGTIEIKYKVLGSQIIIIKTGEITTQEKLCEDECSPSAGEHCINTNTYLCNDMDKDSCKELFMHKKCYGEISKTFNVQCINKECVYELPSGIEKGCELWNKGLSCKDFTVYENGVQLTLKNNLGKDIEIHSENLKKIRIDNGKQEVITLKNFKTGKLGEKINGTIAISYNIIDSDVWRYAVGHLIGKVEKKEIEEVKEEIPEIPLEQKAEGCSIRESAITCDGVVYENEIQLKLINNIGKNIELSSLKINVGDSICTATITEKKIINDEQRNFILIGCTTGSIEEKISGIITIDFNIAGSQITISKKGELIARVKEK